MYGNDSRERRRGAVNDRDLERLAGGAGDGLQAAANLTKAVVAGAVKVAGNVVAHVVNGAAGTATPDAGNAEQGE